MPDAFLLSTDYINCRYLTHLIFPHKGLMTFRKTECYETTACSHTFLSIP